MNKNEGLVFLVHKSNTNVNSWRNIREDLFKRAKYLSANIPDLYNRTCVHVQSSRN